MNQARRHARRDLLSRAIAGTVLAVACLALAAHAREFDFVSDDAFISFRYAQNLVRHGELTYNPGERVEGYTNFLWTVTMAAVLALGGDPVRWSQAIGIAASVATLLVLFSFSTWWARTLEAPRAPSWAALAPLLLAASSPFAAWSEGGLETALFTLLATAAALGHVVEVVDERPRPWSGVATALAALTRPEGLMLFALLGAHRVAHALGGGRGPSRLGRLLAWAGAFAIVFVPYWTWRWIYYGYPLPNTYYAKAGAPLWGPGWRYVESFAWDTQAWVAAVLLVVPWWGARRARTLKSLVVAIVAAWTLYVASLGGDFMALHRFLVPVLPLLALAAQEGLASLWRWAVAGWPRLSGRPATARGNALAVAAVLGLLGAAAVHDRGVAAQALEVGSRDGVDSIGWLKQFVVQTTAIGRYLASTYPPGTRIATTAAGALPYYSEMPTVDLLGLSDLYVAHQVPATSDRPGHRRGAPEAYVLQRRPRLIIWHPWISEEAVSPPAPDAQYWRDRGYAFRSVRVPGLDPPYWSYLEAEGGRP
jgi:arabinofuranosyltransferase